MVARKDLSPHSAAKTRAKVDSTKPAAPGSHISFISISMSVILPIRASTCGFLNNGPATLGADLT